MGIFEYIDDLVAKGRCTFTINEAQKELKKSRGATISSIEHLKKQKKVACPAKGFCTIVMPEYRIYECLPAEYFIPYLMEYWQMPYYVGLVTAASYLGACHQQPQIFQVMLEQYHKPIICGKVRVEFVANKHLRLFPTQQFTTQYSELIISTTETTAMDLVNYPQKSGGLNRIATILDELQDDIKEQALANLLLVAPHLCWKQRLGYILEKLGADNLTQVILEHLQQRQWINYIPLDPLYPAVAGKTYSKNKTWKIIENTSFESDL